MARRKSEGVESLVKLESISLDQITMLDFFAAMTLIGLSGGDLKHKAQEAYDQAEEMMLERLNRS
jgi:hypothetical protein